MIEWRVFIEHRMDPALVPMTWWTLLSGIFRRRLCVHSTPARIGSTTDRRTDRRRDDARHSTAFVACGQVGPRWVDWRFDSVGAGDIYIPRWPLRYVTHHSEQLTGLSTDGIASRLRIVILIVKGMIEKDTMKDNEVGMEEGGCISIL